MLQRDMDGRPLAALGDTPFEEGRAAGVIDLGGNGVSLSTGDNFVTAAGPGQRHCRYGGGRHRQGLHPGRRALHLLEIVTDLADENATANWRGEC
ncbi:MAG: hypothetical protein CM15mP115_00340 [Alphaproteobacteria bacterium]|nr:MAG: hypothetical protein CM15mP115_00340 [Alphaproteobacteria bacterium]